MVLVPYPGPGTEWLLLYYTFLVLVIKGSPGVLATLQAWLILLSLHSAFRIPLLRHRGRPGTLTAQCQLRLGTAPFAAAGRRCTAASAWGAALHGVRVLPDALPALTRQRLASVRG